MYGILARKPRDAIAAWQNLAKSPDDSNAGVSCPYSGMLLPRALGSRGLCRAIRQRQLLRQSAAAPPPPIAPTFPSGSQGVVKDAAAWVDGKVERRRWLSLRRASKHIAFLTILTTFTSYRNCN
jgi:hypothetical protein